MQRKRLRNMLLTIVACFSAIVQPGATSADTGKVSATGATPDLRISEFVFATTNEKAVRVHVANTGGAASPLCILRLTVRKINGIPTGRITEVKLPPLASGKDQWLVINARGILPNNVSLVSTTFKLNVDATSIVRESDEANNEVWHNL